MGLSYINVCLCLKTSQLTYATYYDICYAMFKHHKEGIHIVDQTKQFLYLIPLVHYEVSLALVVTTEMLIQKC